MTARAWARIRGLRRREDGGATVEFVILFPFFMVIFMSTFELGMALTRQMMLDRALDLAIRQVRIGELGTVTHDALKDLVCQQAMVPGCQRELRLEMRTVPLRNWRAIPAQADCVNRANEAQAAREFTPGLQNQLMLVRACALYDPFFPTVGLGAAFERESGDAYALRSNSAFVIEPDKDE